MQLVYKPILGVSKGCKQTQIQPCMAGSGTVHPQTPWDSCTNNTDSKYLWIDLKTSPTGSGVI